MDYASLREIPEQELVDYFSGLFWSAFDKAPFEVLCAVLRVSGMQDPEWDPLEESTEAFEDFNGLLRQSEAQLSQKARWRVGLLMYCHAIEMTAPLEFLANLLRVLADANYHVKPFGHLGRTQKKRAFSWVPPSAPAKYRELRTLAGRADQDVLAEYVDLVFEPNIRNAFSHSDYIISKDHFRWTESGVAQQIPLDTVNLIVRNCFRFFSALLWLHRQVLKDLPKLPKYHKWPDYEVLEILSNDDGLTGFSVHFSNGAKATYTRTHGGVACTNIMFEREGSINFFVGSLDALTDEWKVDGKTYVEGDY